MAYDVRDELVEDARTPASYLGDVGSSFPGVDNYNAYYDYDLAGNVTEFRGSAPDTIANEFNLDNQIEGSGFTFDGEGDPLTDFGDLYTFDPEDRATTVNQNSFTATYDGDGVRAVESDTTSGTVYFVNDASGHPLLEEQMVSGTPKIIWAHAI